MRFLDFCLHPGGITYNAERIARHMRHIALAKQRLKRIRHELQRTVTFFKAKPLVKGLEILQIKGDKRIAFPRVPKEQVLHVVREQKRIREPRQLVMVTRNFRLLRQAHRPENKLHRNRKRKPEEPRYKDKVIQKFRSYLDHAHAHIHGEVH